MTTSTAMAIASAATLALAAGSWCLSLLSSEGIRSRWERYGEWWRSRTAPSDHPLLARAPMAQLVALVSGLLTALWVHPWSGVAIAAAAAAGPPLLMRRRHERRTARLAEQLDPMLTALSNALATTPNLGDALGSIRGHLDPPMREEIETVLAETRLGRPIDDALLDMARRAGAPGFEPAVAAAIMGRRTGGNLPSILESTARTLREIARLEGVVKTKTAEGRNQALVMGLVPPLLIAALHKIDPTWLEPMWRDPIGWILLGTAAILEIAAIALIRKIMAVDI